MNQPQQEKPGVEVATFTPEQAQLAKAIVTGQPWTDDQVQLVKTSVCNAADLTDPEAALFMAQAQRLGLDPIARQIHAVKRQGKLTIQIGIDGYRKIADDTGLYAGNDEPVFVTQTISVAREGLEVGADVPVKATVTVHKIVAGESRPFTASARWAEYYPGEGKDGFFWRKMPFGQLGKCAEAAALRKAFPAQLGGFYIPEEMDQAGGEGQESGDGGNGRQRRSQTPQRAIGEGETKVREQLEKLGAPHSTLLPWGDDKGKMLGQLSTEHVKRLAVWAHKKEDEDSTFGPKWRPIIEALDSILDLRSEKDRPEKDRPPAGIDAGTGEVQDYDPAAGA